MNSKLIFFDLEGVLIQGKNIWERMHEQFGTEKEDRMYLREFLAKKFGYEEWVKKVVQLWKGRDIKILYDLIESIEYSKGIDSLFGFIREEKITSYIISTAIDQLVKKVAKDLNIESYLATKIIESDGKITGDAKIGCTFYTKGDALIEVSKRYGISTKKTIAIGDAINDVSMFEVAGVSIAFNSSCDKLKSIATYVVDSNDLEDVLTILKKIII